MFPNVSPIDLHGSAGGKFPSVTCAEDARMVATPVVGSEITFSTDPTAEIPRVTALAGDTFVLAWGDRHLR